MSLYLDYNASAPILPEVLDTMIEAYKNTPGNADSRTHIYGTNAQKLVNESRASIASVLGVDPSEILFTSGSCEGNNTVVLGILDYLLNPTHPVVFQQKISLEKYQIKHVWFQSCSSIVRQALYSR